MTTLADHIDVSPRFARSANLERDITAAGALDGYIVTARAIDVVERLAATANSTNAGGAWSITGPYGSGKSSLAVLLDGAFGEAGAVRDKALSLITDVAPEVATAVHAAHEHHQTTNRGFHRAVITASREPVAHTVLAALHSAVIRSFGKIPRSTKFSAASELKAALADAASEDPRRTGPSPAAILAVARCLAEQAPLLIVIDEFGKNLEAVDQSADTDPYLLQQLAEAGQGSGAPIFTLTLQHLSFEDYFVGGDGPQQREWAKVQGRFEDIPYIDSPAQTRALIGTVFKPISALQQRIDKWAATTASAMTSVGIQDLTRQDVVADCYPLHPLAAAVLPELCSRYGQNERTLFSFLTGSDPAAVPAILAGTDLSKTGRLPFIGLSEVYDYFVAGGVVTSAAGPHASRWTEIATRLRDTYGLSPSATSLAKSVAILNLVSASGTLRASKQLLTLLHPKPSAALSSLEAQSLVTYREFADEYRLWQGSDLDLRDMVDTAMNRMATRPLVDILTAVDNPQPVIAARHSAQHDILRVFSQRYVTGTEPIDPLSPFAESDGEVLLVVGPGRTCPQAPLADGPTKPAVAAIPHDLKPLDAAARTVAAIHATLELPDVASDWVARAELAEQLAQAEATLRATLIDTFAATKCDWFLITPEGPQALPTGRGSAALSAAADLTYDTTPLIGNEMINRTDVTSQGAKARRLLLQGMIEQTGQIDLGFEGYGPEVAMYRSILQRSGMHRMDDRNNTMAFAGPKEHSMTAAWNAMDAEFKRARTRRINIADIHAVLQSPPIGMKAGVIPVFVTAGLLANADEVAIYEHGTFKPVLGTDVSERMVKNPNHFDIKHFANASGARRELIDALADELGVAKRFRKHRVSNVLAIVGHLVGVVGNLDNYTLKTNTLSPKATGTRDAILTAIEPDELLFEHLPTALGFPQVQAGKPYPKSKISLLARSVRTAIEELVGNFDALLKDLFDALLAATAETSRKAVSGQAAALQDEVLDSEVRAFILTVANDAAPSDDDWIKAIATVVSKRAVAEWSDSDRSRFDFELSPKIAAFHRLLALHADQRAQSGASFDAVRVTFTRPDGREEHRLATVTENERAIAESTLGSAVDQLRAALGSDTKAQHVLLALLGEQILPTVTPKLDNEVIDITERKANHG